MKLQITSFEPRNKLYIHLACMLTTKVHMLGGNRKCYVDTNLINVVLSNNKIYK